MNFEQVIRQLHETEVLMAEIQLRQAENVVHMRENMRVHEKRMAHIDMRLASITDKLGFMSGHFKGPR